MPARSLSFGLGEREKEREKRVIESGEREREGRERWEGGEVREERILSARKKAVQIAVEYNTAQ